MKAEHFEVSGSNLGRSQYSCVREQSYLVGENLMNLAQVCYHKKFVFLSEKADLVDKEEHTRVMDAPLNLSMLF